MKCRNSSISDLNLDGRFDAEPLLSFYSSTDSDFTLFYFEVDLDLSLFRYAEALDFTST